MEDVGDTGLARCWAEGPAVGCAAHAALASTTTRAAAAMAPRMCLSPLSPREPVTNRLRVCCSGARAGIIMPLPGAGSGTPGRSHRACLRHDDGRLRVRFGISGPYPRPVVPVKESLASTAAATLQDPLDRTPHAAAPPTTQSTTDEVLGLLALRVAGIGLADLLEVQGVAALRRIAGRRAAGR